MSKLLLPLIMGVIIAAIPVSTKAQLVVTPSTPAGMVSRLVNATGGVTTSNITMNGAAADSYGEFNCTGPCNLGMPGGILLTSGTASLAVPPNASPGHTGFNGGGTDPQLHSLLSDPTHTINDACVLEFDFWSQTDVIEFNYRFASEEYNEYVSGFNDVFGFFINGPGIAGTQNIAVLPGTSTPVSIFNINNGTNNPATGPCVNCAYYVDNSTAPFAVTTAYDGITTLLTATANVCPCETYHIKLAVGDANDSQLDSGVFLEENSFNSIGQINVYAGGVSQPDNATIYLCVGDSVTLSVLDNFNCSNLNVTWSTGSTNSSIVVNQTNVGNGTFAATVTHPVNQNCFSFTTFLKVVFINPADSIAINGNTSICPGGTTTLTAAPTNTPTLPVTYLWSNGQTTQSINVGAGTYTVTATVLNSCTASVTETVTVGSASATITPSGPTTLCIGGSVTLNANPGTNYLWSTGDTTQSINVTTTGSYSVTVTQSGGCSATSSIVNVTVNPGLTPTITGNTTICQGSITTLNAGAGYSGYQWSGGLGFTQNVNVSATGPYTVTVTDATGCTGSASVTITVNPLPVPAISGNTSICTGSTSTLDAGSGFASYQWSGGLGSSQTITIGSSGIYTVTVTDANGCTATASATVTVGSATATISPSGPTSFCIGDNVTLTANSGTDFLWSTGDLTQSITVSQSGTFTVTVTQAGGCTASSAPVSVTVNPLPVPSITGNTTICLGATTIFDAGPGYTSYQWSPSGSGQTFSTGTAGNYTVTVTDANGCTGSANINLSVNPSPSPAITGNNILCQGETTTLDAGSGYSAYLWSNSAGSAQTATVGSSANYIVTVTDANGCTGTANLNVTVNPLPTPAITGATNICQGATTTLDAGSGYTDYLWSGNIQTQTLSTGISGNYSVTVTDANGCTGTASVNVTVNPLPVPSITGNTTICQGATTIFDAGPGYTSYQWSPSGSGQTLSAGTAGNYVVTVTDANGCTGTASATLTVNTASAAITAQGPTTFCQGDNVILTANSGSGYLWNNGETTQNITVSASGIYTVIVTAANGCTALSAPVATVVSIPTASAVAQSSTTLCPGDNVTITANPGSSYLWSNGELTQSIVVSQAGNYSVSVTNSIGCVAVSNVVGVTQSQPAASITPLGPTTFCDGDDVELEANVGSAYLWSTGAVTRSIIVTTPGLYTVTVTNSDNCTAVSQSEQITVNTAIATINALGSTTFCPGDNVVLEANSGQSYLWSNGEQTQSITVSVAGTYTVTVVNNNGCTATASPVATTVSVPQAIITPLGSTTICPGSTVTLNANAGSNYLWSTGEQTQAIQVSQAGNYAVTVTNADGCDTVSSPVQVVIDTPVAIATAQGPTNFCVGDHVIISANSGSAYLWSTGETTQSISATTAGVYTVSVTNTTGCTEVSNDIHVTTMNAVANITALGPTIFCPGGDVTLEANPGLSYTWSTGESTQSITVSNDGTYTVNVVNNNGCDATSAPIQVTVSPLPQISFTADKLGGCDPFTPQFINNTITDNQATYLWDFGDSTTSASVNPSHTYHGVGLYTVTLQATSSFGCFAEFTYPDMIIVSESPVADFMFMNENGGGTEPLLFNSTIRFIDQSIDASHWIWSFGDGFNSNEQNPIHTYSGAGEFRILLTVLNQYDCPATKEAQVMVTPFYIPNAFTPDQDGKNDAFFEINFEMNVASFELQVFNRWGEMIFKSTDPRKPWRGETMKGRQAPEGVYVYQIMIKDHNDRDHEYRGSVSLLR
jgi:large repetitive protein